MAVRYLCADTHPDHDSICKFRCDNEALFKRSFNQVLECAARAKVFKVGDITLAADGTKILAKAGRDLYAQRKQTIEPVFCIIKSAMGFRQFGLRGKSKASLEWTLVPLSYNLKRPGQSPRKNRVAGRRRPLS